MRDPIEITHFKNNLAVHTSTGANLIPRLFDRLPHIRINSHRILFAVGLMGLTLAFGDIEAQELQLRTPIVQTIPTETPHPSKLAVPYRTPTNMPTATALPPPVTPASSGENDYMNHFTWPITPQPLLPTPTNTPLPPSAEPRPKVIPKIPPLGEFVNTVKGLSPSEEVAGVYVSNVLALKVMQQPQPKENPNFVYAKSGVVTQYGNVERAFGVTAFLAHNYLNGSYFDGTRFFNLKSGEQVTVVYGDGSLRKYVIVRLRHFQTKNPNDLFSDLIDLDNGNSLITNLDVFKEIYEQAGNPVVFQTCITKPGNPIWGKLFVIASQVNQTR